jgi:hypothetical protein
MSTTKAPRQRNKEGAPPPPPDAGLQRDRSKPKRVVGRPWPSHTKRPYRKSTNDEIEARVDETGRMLALRMTKTQIHQEAGRLWGCHWRTADRYMARARKQAIKNSQRPKEDHLAQAVAFNKAVIRSPDAKWSDKLAANRDNSELLGLYPPRTARLEASRPGGAVEIINIYWPHELPQEAPEQTGCT